MMWLLLSVLSSMLLGAYDAAKKWSVRENAVPMVLLCSVSVGAALYLPLIILSNLDSVVATRIVHELTWSQHQLIFLKSALVGLSWMLAFSALKRLPLSVGAPIRATSPLWTILIALLYFEERPSLIQWIGIATVLVGFWRFTLVGRREGIHFRRDRSVALMVLATLLGACSSIYDKWLLQSAKLDPTTLQAWFTVYLVPVMVPLAVRWYHRDRSKQPFRWRRSIALISPLLIAADWFYFSALADPEAMISVVSVVRRSSVAIALVFGARALQEANLRAKSVCVGIILVGVALLTWHG
ncbi:MAG: EamA family transporter [Planctomycetota bacterium]